MSKVKENSTPVIETPLMKQYASIKAKYPDALLLFRVGDFYETFGEDAVRASSVLGIVLTRRANGAATFIELAGFPHHSLDTYLPKLVRAGMRVAICDQLEDPKLTKKLVKRGVTELVTPGVSYNDKILESRVNNFLAGIHIAGDKGGAAFLDVSTGEFYIADGNTDYIDKLLQNFKPSEVILQKNMQTVFTNFSSDKFYINTFDDWVFTTDFARETLLKQFGTSSLKGFGVDEMAAGIIAAGATLHYLAETQHDKVAHITKISRIDEEHYVWLDKFTIRNLELVNSINDQGATLLSVLDKTITPMGSRLLRRWILMPLKDKKPIEERQDMVAYFIANPEIAEELRQQLKVTGDLERLISKTAVGRVNPREVLQIRKALLAVDPAKEICNKAEVEPLKRIAEQLNPCAIIRERIGNELHPDPPVSAAKGNVIADGVSAELDELRAMAYSGKDYLLKMQQRESEKTGIPSLKVGYNSVFGYYLEVTNTHKDKVPSEWVRKQTLVNCERYITEELKEYEEKILGAEERILNLETSLFNDLIIGLTEYVEPVQLNAALLSRLDCILSFAKVAVENHYTRPGINDSQVIDIKGGRHPVIEKQLPASEEYIANDVCLDNEEQQILIITGPNMSGKSALLRQTALIVLMAQTGSYVPAETAQTGIVDKIFTRVGASDNITSGESTFMVEMNETASILNNISGRSLILLDEIGRGTSTYDGISIAWAIAEFLHDNLAFRPKVLFATHYHELNEMASSMKRIKNFHVSVKEAGNKVIFLRKLMPGGTEHSFGIHVAKMAGMPNIIIERANQLLKSLELAHGETPSSKNGNSHKTTTDDNFQLSFIQLNDPLLEQLRDEITKTDINTLTPVEALMKLNEIKKMLG